jgi:acetolactate synthase-1/2/3 large subunit
VKLAEAYGIPAIRVTDKVQVESAIRWAMDEPGPVVVDFMVEPEENVYPMIPAGESLAELMEEPIQEAIFRT